MLEELFNLVKEYAGDAVDNNPEVPNEQNNEVVAEATNTVASGFRNIVAGGGVQSLVQLFQQKSSDGNEEKSGIGNMLQNPIVAMMVGHFANKLMTKYKLGGNEANNVASSLIPNVINGLINKTNSSDDNGFSVENLLNSITGGQANTAAQNSGLDIGSLISQFTQGNNSNSGGGGLMDIVKQLAGGAQQQQQKNGGDGLMDLIKGFIK